MDTTQFTFGKSERLKGKIRIDNLYKEGKSFMAFPFFVKYISSEETKNNKVLVSVSKRRFKNATDRNLIKRRIKEAYRLNKNMLSTKSTLIALNYVAKTPLDIKVIEQKMVLMFKRLNQLNPKDNVDN